MLRELHISGLGVIEDLDLELHEGLNVLTGETGAGKTMIAIGLALALGSRASSAVVREGAPTARVQARFDATPDLEEWADEGELVLARAVGADGKSSARISGQIATASALAEVGSSLVEMHGQHEAQRLLGAGTQTAFLDRFAGNGHLVTLASYRETYQQLRSATRALEALQTAARDRERELDLLAYQVGEIEAVGPVLGESERLEADESRLAHIERLLASAAFAHERLVGEEGVVEGAAAVAAALADVASFDPRAADLADRAKAAATDLGELAADLRGYGDSLQVDPESLEAIRERIAALKGLRRKYGADDAEVLEFLAGATERVAALVGADEQLSTLDADAEALRIRLGELASTISAGRTAAAGRLARAIGGELKDLGMPGADVEVALETLPDLGPAGAESVELRLSPVPGRATRALSKTASGGELSRVMLACRSVMADLDEVPTLVFDEIDAGIGGEAGLAVGRRLARLAVGRQILVVTHLPQIACFADRHVRIVKSGDTAAADVLRGDDRTRELSRMLAGLPGSERALSHAEELLAEAERARVAS